MKPKFLVLLTTFISILTVSAAENAASPDTTGKTGAISLILGGIKKEQANKAVAETNLATTQRNRDSQKPDLEKQKEKHVAEAQKIFNEHDKKHEEGSAAHTYWQGKLNEQITAASEYQRQIDALQQAVDDAQDQLDAAIEALEDWQQQLQDLGKVPATSWDCFFDGKCNDYPAEPEVKPGFRMTPNSPASGAPPVYTELSKEYKNRYNPDNRPVPLPRVEPPQKDPIQQATDKVKEMFNNVIKKAQQYKTRRVATAVLAVRG